LRIAGAASNLGAGVKTTLGNGMAFKKGEPRPPNAGRKVGSSNKLTKDVKEMILGALSAKGGQRYLEEQASANPIAFLTLLGKVLPLQVSGEGGGPMVINLVQYDGER
jgi:hypothetical protein